MVEDEDRPIRTGRLLLVVVGSFVAFIALRVVLDGVLSLDGSLLLTPSAGLAVPLGILFGIPAAVGILAAALVAQAMQAGLTMFGVFESLSLFALAAVSALGWQSEIELPTGSALDVQGIPGFAIITAIGTVGAASILAWGGEILGLFPFYVLFVDTLLRYLVATAIVAPFVAGLSLLSGRRGNLWSSEMTATFGPGFALIPAIWAIMALIGSIGFNIRERIPLVVFENMGIEFLYYLVHPDIFGRGGRRIQVVFGAVMLVAWMYVFKYRRKTTAGNASAVNDDSVPSLDSERTTVSSRTEEAEV